MKPTEPKKSTGDNKAKSYKDAFAEMTRLNKSGTTVFVMKKINHSKFKVVQRPKLTLEGRATAQ
jgi:hypothetical protein